MSRDYENASPTQYQRVPSHTRDEVFIKDLLRRGEIAHVAHSRGDQPFITPTNYWYDEDRHRIIFHSNITGRTRDNLAHAPKVCMEVSEYGRFLPANTALEFGIQYRSVMLFGTVHILKEAQDCKDVLYKLLKKYFPDLTPGQEYRPITDQEMARTTVYAIQIESWSGKENWDDAAEVLPDWPPLPEKFLK